MAAAQETGVAHNTGATTQRDFRAGRFSHPLNRTMRQPAV
jgi:hypothetical protein